MHDVRILIDAHFYFLRIFHNGVSQKTQGLVSPSTRLFYNFYHICQFDVDAEFRQLEQLSRRFVLLSRSEHNRSICGEIHIYTILDMDSQFDLQGWTYRDFMVTYFVAVDSVVRNDWCCYAEPINFRTRY